ncbi:MAG: metallophosphoesterase family protein, partial [Anaerolineae bacterium]|nr:metallophosphoesterase family protein [Anaerolineae bacterium]
LAFGGHTHRAMDRQLGDDHTTWRFVNPGSVGMPMDGDQRASYALVAFTDGEAAVDIRRVAYDVDAVITTLEQQQHPAIGWIGERLRTAQAPH